MSNLLKFSPQPYTGQSSMTNVDKLFDRARRDLIGFDPLFTFLLDEKRPSSDGYPPYNIEKLDEEHWAIIVALAGFSANDIDLIAEGQNLTISSKPSETDTERHFLHRGIAKRAFERRFVLGEDVTIAGADLKDGLLTINLEKIVPESKKPRRIEISQ